MADNSPNSQNNEINIEEISDKIRTNIRRRKIAGGLPADSDFTLNTAALDASPFAPGDAIQCDFLYVNSNWDIRNTSYLITSHRPYIGKFLVKGRQLVHGEVRRYIDPILYRQTDFNACTVRILTRTLHQYRELEDLVVRFQKDVDRKISDTIFKSHHELESKINRKAIEYQQNLDAARTTINQSVSLALATQSQELEERFAQRDADHQANLDAARNSVEQSVSQAIATACQDLDGKIERQDAEFQKIISTTQDTIEKKIDTAGQQTKKEVSSDLDKWMISAEQRFTEISSTSPSQVAFSDISYLGFEERFRGPSDEIRRRQEAFLPHFTGRSNVLDIGCGRGEFLEILRDNNIGGRGIDIDPEMIAHCRSRNLEVLQGDAMKYLNTCNDESIDGIFIDQVVEHLQPRYLIQLLSLCFRKLKTGSHIVIETVNPLSFYSFVNFYGDMTHTRPVHPETLHYLMMVVGFTSIEKQFLSPLPHDQRMRKMIVSEEMTAVETRNIEEHNRNVDILNNLLLGSQDYAIIAKK